MGEPAAGFAGSREAPAGAGIGEGTGGGGLKSRGAWMAAAAARASPLICAGSGGSVEFCACNPDPGKVTAAKTQSALHQPADAAVSE